MCQRHAYLIMAHTDYALLTEILKDLDHERNDIFLHMDLKSGNYPLEQLQSAVCKARFFPVSRMTVNWAGYSQIACELHLLECALETGPHQFYHLMTGATCPIYSQERIHSYFEAHPQEEFIGYFPGGSWLHRVCCYNLFNEVGKPRTPSDDRKIRVRELCNALQARLHLTYPPAKNVDFRKGFAYWSITEDAAQYIISRKSWIEKVFRHSICADELFVQTVLWNSPFRSRIHCPKNEYDSCMRYVKSAESWKPDFGSTAASSSSPDISIRAEDVPQLLEMDRLFAMKFEGEEGLTAIKLLRASRKA